jgi:ACR3 family arsenite transporter
LGAASRYGRLLLVAGLLAGLFIPSAAAAVRPHVGTLIAGLLFLACLRIGPRQAIGAAADLGIGLRATLALQLVMPLVLVGLLRIAGWNGPNVLALTLMAAASPISGTPALVVMLGNDPAPALRQLVVGTALLPFTALIVFALAPSMDGAGTVFLAAARLLGVIGVAAALAFALRATVVRELSPARRDAIDGLSALTMGVVVVGLMSAVGETWPHDPQAVLTTAALAFAANFGLQIAASLVAARSGLSHLAVSLGVSAGNRNMALFLTALPATTTDAALLFIGCYQVPMYLTPLFLGRWYRSNVTPAR